MRLNSGGHPSIRAFERRTGDWPDLLAEPLHPGAPSDSDMFDASTDIQGVRPWHPENKMKNFKLAALAAGLALVITPSAFAAMDTDTASSSAGAEIVTAISIANNGGLHFGDIVPSGALGAVEVSVAGARTESGGVTLGNGGNARAAEFTVTGDSGATFDVTLPSSILIASGVNDMVVDTFTENAVGTLTGGTETFDVGATLHVEASQPAGAYSGSFDVIATYN